MLDLDLNTVGNLGSSLEDSDTASPSSTLVGAFEPGLVDATVNELARALAFDRRLNPLYSAALLRMTRSIFHRHLITALVSLSKSVQKLARIPLEGATAWMVRHYKSPIALRIYELVRPEGYTADGLRLSLHQVPSAQQEQLMRFVNERFPAIEISHVEVEDNDPPQDAGQENDVEEPPDASVLMDPSQVEQILCSGEAFEEMHKQLKSTLLPSPSQLIKKVLRRHISHDDQPKSITCVIEWQILEYFSHEGITIDDLDSISTLTGEFDCACAVRLGDYIIHVWSMEHGEKDCWIP